MAYLLAYILALEALAVMDQCFQGVVQGSGLRPGEVAWAWASCHAVQSRDLPETPTKSRRLRVSCLTCGPTELATSWRPPGKLKMEQRTFDIFDDLPTPRLPKSRRTWGLRLATLVHRCHGPAVLGFLASRLWAKGEVSLLLLQPHSARGKHSYGRASEPRTRPQ